MNIMCESIKRIMESSNCDLIIGVDVNDNFYCHLKDGYISSDGVLISESGRGKELSEAILDYIRKISNKTLVIRPDSKYERKEIFICSLFIEN